MFCTNCGKQLKGGTNFCPYCGTKQKAIPLKETPEDSTEISAELSRQEQEEYAVEEATINLAAEENSRAPVASESPETEIFCDANETVEETDASIAETPFVEEPETAPVFQEESMPIKLDPITAKPILTEHFDAEQIAEALPIVESPPPILRSEASVPIPQNQSSQSAVPPPKRKSKRKLIGILGGVAGVIVVALAIFLSIYNKPINKFERALNAGDYNTAGAYYGSVLSQEEAVEAIILIEGLIDNALEDYSKNLASYESITQWLESLSAQFGELDHISFAKEKVGILQASQEQYQRAVNAEANGDIYTAIQHYSNVSNQDPQYETAQKKAEELKTKYKNEIIDHAKNLAAKDDFAGACAVLRECQSQLGDDPDITALIEEYEGGIRSQDITDSLSKAEESARNRDYLTAINLLKKADEQYKSDSQITAKLAEYKQRYKEQVIKEANEAAENSDCAKGYELLTDAKAVLGSDLDAAINDFKKLWEEKALAYAESLAKQSKYEDAVQALNNVMKKIGETTSLQERVREYEKKYPVSLLDLTPVSGEIEVLRRGDRPDIYGNYPNANASFYDTYSEAEFLAEENYSGISGTIIVPYTYNTGASGYIYIYADGKLVYTSPKFDKKTEPIHFDVNISGAKFVTIEIDSYWQVALSDPIFHN